jgi:hypothetical protein
MVYRIALEIEDLNISAKNTNFYYQDNVYYKKDKELLNLFNVLKQYNYDTNKY